MIKTFEQFALNESQYKNFFDKYIELEHECLMSIIDIVKYFGGEVEARENDIVDVYVGLNDHRTNRVNIYSYAVKQNSKEDFPVLDPYKNDNGEYFVAIDEDGNEINFDVEELPMSQIFYISDYLCDYFERNRNKK